MGLEQEGLSQKLKFTTDLHLLLSKDFTSEVEAVVSDVLSKIEQAWDHEEKFWEQRARTNWLTSGDQNTSFFHASTLHRRRRNKILKLKVGEDLWVEKEEDIANEFVKFYRDLFTANVVEDIDGILDFVQPEISEEDNGRLMEMVSDEEIKAIVFQLGGMKAPCPDGFTGLFYHAS